jgi:hypothetical protein
MLFSSKKSGDLFQTWATWMGYGHRHCVPRLRSTIPPVTWNCFEIKSIISKGTACFHMPPQPGSGSFAQHFQQLQADQTFRTVLHAVLIAWHCWFLRHLLKYKVGLFQVGFVQNVGTYQYPISSRFTLISGKETKWHRLLGISAVDFRGKSFVILLYALYSGDLTGGFYYETWGRAWTGRRWFHGHF